MSNLIGHCSCVTPLLVFVVCSFKNALLIKCIFVYIITINFKFFLTFDSPSPKTLTITSITVSCIPNILIRLGCW